MRKTTEIHRRVIRRLQFFASNMRCRVCGGWGGEFGDAKGVGPMCSFCYFKKYGTYD